MPLVICHIIMTQMHVLSKFTMAFFSAITDQEIRELFEESDEEMYDDDDALDQHIGLALMILKRKSLKK